jgi:hypothetical protein
MEFACDPKTRFPCVRVADWFFSLLPLTKLQVERYISSGAAAQDYDALLRTPVAHQDELRALLWPRTLEKSCDYIEGGRYQFNQEVHWRASNGTTPIDNLLRRRPLEALRVEESLLATNLAHCVYRYNFKPKESVPQDWTPMDRILRWLGARQALEDESGTSPLPTPGEYGQAETRFQAVPAAEFIRAALQLTGIARGARRVLEILALRRRFQGERGLPFLARGVWELMSAKECRTVSAGKASDTWKPLARGNSPYLPGIGQKHAGHLVLIEHHPAIGCRPIFRAGEVMDHIEIKVKGDQLP